MLVRFATYNDFNCVGAHGGYDHDPYHGHACIPHVVHQCHHHGGADRTPARTPTAGGLHDTAAHLGAPWQATTGHRPACAFVQHRIDRRIDAHYSNAHLLPALRQIHTIDSDLAASGSDHLPVIVSLDTDDITDVPEHPAAAPLPHRRRR